MTRYQLPPSAAWKGIRQTGEVYFTRFKAGVLVQHRPLVRSNGPGTGEPGERPVKDMSSRSRSRAAFALGNAETEWTATTLLTWHYAPRGDTVKPTLAKLSRAFRRRGDQLEAWGMEMHASGIPHFHLFHSTASAFGRSCAAAGRETFANGRVVIRSHGERWLVREWLSATGQEHDAEAVAFNEGGIVEPLRHPDAAGRYLAKEVGKRHQKRLPAFYNKLGRWWHLSRDLLPVARSMGLADLSSWPFPLPFARVWQADQFDRCVLNEWPIEEQSRACADLFDGREALEILFDARKQGLPYDLCAHVADAMLPTDSDFADDTAFLR